MLGETTPPPYHYVGACRDCGATLASVGDRRERKGTTASAVYKMITLDLIVERVRSEVVMLAKRDCGCPRGEHALTQEGIDHAV